MHKKIIGFAALAATVGLLLAGCAGEGSALVPKSTAAPTVEKWSAPVLNIDFATYNPLSLIIKNKGWLEATLGDKVKVNWVQSAGSSAANLALRSGAIDIGSTAGSAALLARSNGSPIKTIDVYSQPNWAAIAVPKGSTIKSVADLKGKTIAVAKSTDPYFFLLQSLEKFKVPLNSVTIENLAHADGKAALESGRVDAWSGLDPLLSLVITVPLFFGMGVLMQRMLINQADAVDGFNQQKHVVELHDAANPAREFAATLRLLGRDGCRRGYSRAVDRRWLRHALGGRLFDLWRGLRQETFLGDDLRWRWRLRRRQCWFHHVARDAMHGWPEVQRGRLRALVITQQAEAATVGGESVLDGFGYQDEDLALFAEANFGFGRVHVDVNQRRIDVEVQENGTMQTRLEEALEPFAHRRQ